jgi:uncharacterized membrane protein
MGGGEVFGIIFAEQHMSNVGFCPPFSKCVGEEHQHRRSSKKAGSYYLEHDSKINTVQSTNGVRVPRLEKKKESTRNEKINA